jgi:hypothetical protein
MTCPLKDAKGRNCSLTGCGCLVPDEIDRWDLFYHLDGDNVGCPADFGEWGAWRASLPPIGDVERIQRAAAACPWADTQKIGALDIAYTVADVAIGAVGWSP